MKLASRIAAFAVGLSISSLVFAALETATYINELVATNPVGATDAKSQGDDHMRMIKSTLQNTFPNLTGAMTATQAELNILDGGTLSTAELNILDGVTSTTAEINILDGVTATATELNTLDGITSTVTELNALDGITVNASQLNAAVSELAAIESGTYSPTATPVLNCAVSTVHEHRYIRTGSIVTVSGALAIGVSAAGATTLRVALPIASAFVVSTTASGAGTASTASISVEANGTNDDLILFWTAPGASSITIYYSAMYRII
jgi:hypothetical protein